MLARLIDWAFKLWSRRKPPKPALAPSVPTVNNVYPLLKKRKR